MSRKCAAERKFDMPAPLRLWHLASLDAPTVAFVWALGFAWAAGVRLPAWVPALLALGAWAVYIGDRLLDAHSALRTGQTNRLRERHTFHHRHRRVLGSLAVGAACAAAWIVFRMMPAGARERDSVLAMAAMAYFSGVHASQGFPKRIVTLLTRLPAKEFLVGVLFTAGCVMPAFSRVGAEPVSAFWGLGASSVYFAELAWLNCHLIERWEAGISRAALGVNCSRRDSSRRDSSAAGLLAGAGLLLAVALSAVQPRSAALVIAGVASSLLLQELDGLRERLTPVALRTAADLVLLTPILLVPMALFSR